jgi:hypothetical protein
MQGNLGVSTLIDKTVAGVVVGNVKTTLSLSNEAPVARPVMVVADVSAYVIAGVVPWASIEIKLPAT